jgi:hypothetical protein
MGAAALAFTPSLSELFAKTNSGNFPKRFIFIRKSSGLRPSEFALPTFSAKEKALENDKKAFEADLDKHELPKWMRGLEKHKEHMTILQGISSKMSENGHSSNQSTMGAFKSNGGTITSLKRATIDFELAKLFPSPFGHVELSFAGGRTGIVPGYSVPAPYQKNYCYADPQTAYEELFKCVLNPAAVNSDNAMLEFLRSEEGQKLKGRKGGEKLNLANHITSLQTICQRNKKLITMSDSLAKHLPTLGKIHANGGSEANTLEKQEAMTDVLLAAMISGMTNVVTYTMDTLSTPIIGLPGNESDRVGIHALGHNERFSGVPAKETRAEIRKLHFKQIDTIIEKLKAAPEGNGNMFDSTMILYFPEGAETHHGTGIQKPYVIMSGKNCQLDIAGRYIRLPYHAKQGHQTLGNLYTTLLNAHGNPIKHYGDFDADMSRLKIDQMGPIKQFMG